MLYMATIIRYPRTVKVEISIFRCVRVISIYNLYKIVTINNVLPLTFNSRQSPNSVWHLYASKPCSLRSSCSEDDYIDVGHTVLVVGESHSMIYY